MYRRCVICGWGRKECIEDIKFYGFPKNPGLQKMQWMQLMAEKLTPERKAQGFKKVDSICSLHFVTGKPHSNPNNVDFVPTLLLDPREITEEIRKKYHRKFADDEEDVKNARVKRLKTLNERMKQMKDLTEEKKAGWVQRLKKRKIDRGEDINQPVSLPLESLTGRVPPSIDPDMEQVDEIIDEDDLLEEDEILIEHHIPTKKPRLPARRGRRVKQVIQHEVLVDDMVIHDGEIDHEEVIDVEDEYVEYRETVQHEIIDEHIDVDVVDDGEDHVIPNQHHEEYQEEEEVYDNDYLGVEAEIDVETDDGPPILPASHDQPIVEHEEEPQEYEEEEEQYEPVPAHYQRGGPEPGRKSIYFQQIHGPNPHGRQVQRLIMVNVPPHVRKTAEANRPEIRLHTAIRLQEEEYRKKESEYSTPRILTGSGYIPVIARKPTGHIVPKPPLNRERPNYFIRGKEPNYIINPPHRIIRQNVDEGPSTSASSK